jgi:2-polyprenyl-6-methoxyphenol hydroxylase-like FAD-dependent oxidoreductase
MQDLQCDVLVVGGGRAGASIAALLAQKGRHIVVLEKDRRPRFHIGESLLPLNLPLFDRLGVAEDGKLVWNRLRYIRTRKTGQRVSRPNPEPNKLLRTYRTCGSSRMIYVSRSRRGRNRCAAHAPARRMADTGTGAVRVISSRALRAAGAAAEHSSSSMPSASAARMPAIKEPATPYHPPRCARSRRARRLAEPPHGPGAVR